jgi:hypothetical protein
VTEPDGATPRPTRPGLLPAPTALLGAATVVLAVHELPDPGGTGPSAVAAPPGAGAVALAVPAVVLLLTAWPARHGRRTGALAALAASSAVGYLAAGAVLGRHRSGTTDDAAPPLLLVLAVLLLAATVAVAAWRALPAGSVTLERRTRVLVGALLLAAVWGLLAARHLPVGPVAGELPVRGTGALSDLVVLPATAAAGGGLLARAAWAGKATFACAGCLALAGVVTVGAVWSPTPAGGAGASAGVAWTATALGVAAAVPAVLCWTAVVRTGRQYWGGPPAAAPAPLPPAARPRLVPVPRSSPEEPASRPTRSAAAVAARGERRSGT